ncbi:hypothetical protein ACWATR_37480 [Nostoc sp. UIC 10890]
MDKHRQAVIALPAHILRQCDCVIVNSPTQPIHHPRKRSPIAETSPAVLFLP